MVSVVGEKPTCSDVARYPLIVPDRFRAIIKPHLGLVRRGTHWHLDRQSQRGDRHGSLVPLIVDVD